MGFRLESLGHQAGIVLEFLGGSSIYLQPSTLAFRLQSSPRCGMVGVLIGAFSEGTGLQTNVSSFARKVQRIHWSTTAGVLSY